MAGAGATKGSPNSTQFQKLLGADSADAMVKSVGVVAAALAKKADDDVLFVSPTCDGDRASSSSSRW